MTKWKLAMNVVNVVVVAILAVGVVGNVAQGDAGWAALTAAALVVGVYNLTADR